MSARKDQEFPPEDQDFSEDEELETEEVNYEEGAPPPAEEEEEEEEEEPPDLSELEDEEDAKE